MKNPSVRQLTYPAPSREPVHTELGWTSQPWTIAGILRTLAHGGYFSLAPAAHDFAAGAGPFAYDAQVVLKDLRG